MGKPSVGVGAFNLVTLVAFTVIQVIAALALTGWLSWALWGIAARNAVVLVLAVGGLLQMAVDQRKSELSRQEVR